MCPSPGLLFGRDRSTVQAGTLPVELVGTPQFIEEHLVQSVPNPGLVPVAQPPARHPRASWTEILPADARLEDEDDPGKDRMVGHARTAALRLGSL